MPNARTGRLNREFVRRTRFDGHEKTTSEGVTYIHTTPPSFDHWFQFIQESVIGFSIDTLAEDNRPVIAECDSEGLITSIREILYSGRVPNGSSSRNYAQIVSGELVDSEGFVYAEPRNRNGKRLAYFYGAIRDECSGLRNGMRLADVLGNYCSIFRLADNKHILQQKKEEHTKEDTVQETTALSSAPRR